MNRCSGYVVPWTSCNTLGHDFCVEALAPLVGVEHFRTSFPKRLLEGADTEASLQGVGQSPSHHVPAVPVQDDHQVEESPGHGQIGDVRGPHLVGPGDPGVPQQVGIDPMLRRRLAGAGTPVDGPQPHDSHQPLHPLPAYRYPLPLQPGLHPPRNSDGNPLAGFRATPIRRNTDLNGIIVSVIRFNNLLLHR